MFICFVISSLHDVEWSDGSLPAELYSPLTIDARQWGVKYAKLIIEYIMIGR